MHRSSHSEDSLIPGNGLRSAALPARVQSADPRSIWFEIGKAISFMLSILSLGPLVVSAFFEPGTRWEDRLSMSLLRVALAGCACFASGLFFYRPPRSSHDPGEPLLQTLPVRMFFWTLTGVAIMFLLSWFLEVYFMPLTWRNQPY